MSTTIHGCRKTDNLLHRSLLTFLWIFLKNLVVLISGPNWNLIVNNEEMMPTFLSLMAVRPRAFISFLCSTSSEESESPLS